MRRTGLAAELALFPAAVPASAVTLVVAGAELRGAANFLDDTSRWRAFTRKLRGA